MEQEKLELTILMPCLNEAETLEICIKKAKSKKRRRMSFDLRARE